MSLLFVVHATATSVLESLLPPNDVVVTAFGQLTNRTTQIPSDGGGTHSRIVGSWLYPVPRITHEHAGPTSAPRVHAVNVFHLSDAEQRSVAPTQVQAAVYADRVASDLRWLLESHARAPVAMWRVEAEPWSESENGSESWWRSGDAAGEPRWSRTFPSVGDLTGGQVVPSDNPTGPNSRHPAQSESGLGSLMDKALIFAGVVTVGILAVEAGPAVFSWIPRKAAPRSNPSRRRGR